MSRRLMLRNASGGGGILPQEYQQVEYIFSNAAQGNAYIDSNYIPHLSHEIYVKFAPYSQIQMCPFSAGTGTYQFIAVIQGNSTSYIRAFSANGQGINVGYYADDVLNITSIKHGDKFRTVMQNLTLGTETVFLANNIAELDGNANNMFLFRRRNSRVTYSGKIYAFWAKNDGEFVANYIPCYRKSDGEIGMYDTVSKTFFTSAGTGTFTKGADVN